MKIYGAISKVDVQDDGTLVVEGIASTEARDSVGEIVKADAIRAAIPDYMEWGAVREMHQAKAAGTAIEVHVDDSGQTILKTHVVDPDAVKKVLTKTYKGFSIGGSVLGRDAVDPTIITGIQLTEISLVDRPANPECKFTMYKGEALEPAKEEPMTKTAQAAEKPGNPAVDELAAMVNKGEITPERLLELAKAGMASAGDSGDELVTVVTKAEALGALKKYMGKEVWDTTCAIDALQSIMWVLQGELEENEKEPGQIADLRAAVERIKAFIASEIMENNDPETPDLVQMSAQASDLAKVGARTSKEDKAHLADIHKALVALGHDCTSGAAKADPAGDMQKVAGDGDALAKALDTANATISDLSKRLKALEDQPAAAKGVLITKAADGGDAAATVEETKDPMALMKMAHQQPLFLARP